MIGQERILPDVLTALVLECGEESGRGCGGVQFLADGGKFGGILFNIFRVDAQCTGVRQLAVNAFELDGYAVIGRAYQLAGFGAGQSQIVHFTGLFILIEPHLLQIGGVEFEQNIWVILLDIALTKLSASGELIVLKVNNYRFHNANLNKNADFDAFLNYPFASNQDLDAEAAGGGLSWIISFALERMSSGNLPGAKGDSVRPSTMKSRAVSPVSSVYVSLKVSGRTDAM